MSVPISLLKKVQDACYQLLEDMRVLSAHPQVAGNPVDEVLVLINRTKPLKASDPIPDDSGDPTTLLHEQFRIPVRPSELRDLEDQAETLLQKFARKPEVAPPLWLRLLPVCCSIIRESGLFEVPNLASLRWLGFNVEVPSSSRPDRRMEPTVNINSNRYYEYREHFRARTLRGTDRPCKTLVELLYDLTAAVDASRVRRLFPYVYFGVRFRTTPIEVSPHAHYMDIRVPLDNRRASLEGLPEWVRHPVEPGYPGPPFPLTDRALLQSIYTGWIEADDADFSEQLNAYCSTLQDFYPDGTWPAEGIDCLLCPGVSWSLHPALGLGAAASIFWGFEGPLTDKQCNVLQMLSQTLLLGIGQFPRLGDAQNFGQQFGRSEVLHSIPYAFCTSIEELRQHQTEKGKVCGFSVPTGLYDAALQCLLACEADEDRIVRSLIRLPQSETLMESRGIAEDLIKELTGPDGIARRLAHARLAAERNPISRSKLRNPGVLVQGPGISVGGLAFRAEIELPVFLDVLILLLKEAIEHSERALRRSSEDQTDQVIRVVLEPNLITISNPCPSKPTRPVASAQEVTLSGLQKHLRSWKIEDGDWRDGLWIRRIAKVPSESHL